MVQIAFFLRFRNQLQRIRPELIPRLEDAVVHAIKEAGGKITGEHSFMRASFNENSPGFWLDMLLLIETLTQTLEKAALDLHGYSLLLGKEVPETANVCRFLAGGKGGVFFDAAAAQAMRPYITVEDQGKWTDAARKYGTNPLFRLNAIKIFVPMARVEFPLRMNARLTDQNRRSAVLVAGQSIEGKRDKIYLRIAGFANSGDSGDVPPLYIRFGSGELNALTDAWAGWKHPPLNEELYTSWEFLFRQRLIGRPSPFTIRTARRFCKLLLNSHCRTQSGKTPVIILEDIRNAEPITADIVIEALKECPHFLVVGICTGELTNAVVEKWKSLFPQLVRANAEESSWQQIPELPLDLWEIGYACFLLGRYFPPDLISQLLEEAGKSPLTISRAFSLLYSLRVIDTPLDPRPWHGNFRQCAEAALGERKDRIRITVRNLLLAWVAKKKIKPCLHLLEILKDLGSAEAIDDSLILQSIHGDLYGTDRTLLENIRNSRILETTAGNARAPILLYIVETLLALHSGNANRIHAAFTLPPPDTAEFPLLKAQVLLNQSLYHVGSRKIDSAMEAVKEASMLCQGKNAILLAQVYRLFALTSLLLRRIGETIDYLGFALENAAKSGEYQDIGMSAYYAAAVQLLYGNLSRAKALAEKACRHFLKAGNPEWADRSRFLMGRVAFETGSCQQAFDLFEDIRLKPEGASLPEKNNLLETWAGRARTFLKPTHTAKATKGRDADIFEIEALCIAGNYSRAAEITGYTSPSAGDEFLGIEHPDWRSGFAQCELLCFSWDDVHNRIFNAYRSIAQCSLSPAFSTAAKQTMQNALRSGQFPEIDPYDVFFHYAWYRVLELSESSQVDISTAVSAAFKRLQSRAGRIDDAETRQLYLEQPFWNKALEQAARALKLV